MNIFKNYIYSCDFKDSFLESLVQSHDPSEIILIFDIYYYYVENNCVSFFLVSLMNRKFRRTAFIWNRNLYKCLYHHFLSISLLNKSINFHKLPHLIFFYNNNYKHNVISDKCWIWNNIKIGSLYSSNNPEKKILNCFSVLNIDNN